jgi:hypothetical protein
MTGAVATDPPTTTYVGLILAVKCTQRRAGR